MRLDATQALTRLKEGNQRFVQGLLSLDALLSHAQARRDQIAAAQEPFAVILGCSDSRAPAEILFDQGLGDLFVIRVAGNIAAPSQIASVEFAVERFGVEQPQRQMPQVVERPAQQVLQVALTEP